MIDKSTAAAPGSGKPSLYVVDAYNFLFRAFHALPPLVTTKGVPTGAVYGLCQMLLRIEREQRPTHLCTVFDAPGGNFRHQLFSGYKAARSAMPPELVPQVELVHRVIAAFGIQSLAVPGFEADDVIATLARIAVAAGMDVVICSSDKDLTQLCGEGISVLDTMRNRMIGAPEVLEKFGVPPERVGDVLALTGDSIDSIPGVDGIGPKTAADLINRYGSLTALLAHAHEVKGKRGEALVAAREVVLLSRELVRLREDVPLPKTLSDLHRVDPDRDRLRALFRELEFTRLVDTVGASSPPGTAATVVPPPGASTSGLSESSSGGGSVGVGVGAAASDEGDRSSASAAPVEEPGASTPAIVPRDPDLVLDDASLASLVEALNAARRFGVAALWESPPPSRPFRAEIVGLGFALPDERRFYLPLSHRYLGAPTSVRAAEAFGRLTPVLESPSIKKCVHDAKTLHVLFRRYGVALAGVEGDGMLAAYLLDASRTRYDIDVIAAGSAIGDVSPRVAWLGSGKGARSPSDVPVEEAGRRLAAEAAAALTLVSHHAGLLAGGGLAGLYQDLELPLAHVLARIECRGVGLDSDSLRSLGQEVGTSLVVLEKEIHELAGVSFNINSNKQLAEVLFVKLALPVIRRTKTGASTDVDTLEELAALHPVPAKIVEYRGLTKLKGTYIDALPALVDPATGRLHTSFNQAVAATGRLSSSDPNLQNIPIRSDLGRRIRQAFVAKPGTLLVSADYSQIELRVLAHFSDDPAFLDAFRSGQDIHQRTAAEVFGLPIGSVTPDHRRIAKAINFGLVFGQSDFGLAQALRIPRAQARAYIDSYFRQYAGVRSYMDRAIAEARTTGEVTTLLGRRRPLPEIRSSRVQDRNYAERIARNSPIQGTAADLLKLAMILVDKGIDEGAAGAEGAELLLTVHDELVFEVPEAGVEAFARWVKLQMESVFTLKVPLVVDVGWGRTWGDAHQ